MRKLHNNEKSLTNLLSENVLSEVFGQEVTNVNFYEDISSLRIIAYFGEARQAFFFNINELGFLCKDWCFEQGYELVSRIMSNDNQKRGHCYIVRCENENDDSLAIFNTNTEIESILEATNWVFKRRELQYGTLL